MNAGRNERARKHPAVLDDVEPARVPDPLPCLRQRPIRIVQRVADIQEREEWRRERVDAIEPVVLWHTPKRKRVLQPLQRHRLKPPDIFQSVMRADVRQQRIDLKSTRLHSSHVEMSYAVFCSKKKLARHERI